MDWIGLLFAAAASQLLVEWKSVVSFFVNVMRSALWWSDFMKWFTFHSYFFKQNSEMFQVLLFDNNFMKYVLLLVKPSIIFAKKYKRLKGSVLGAAVADW